MGPVPCYQSRYWIAMLSDIVFVSTNKCPLRYSRKRRVVSHDLVSTFWSALMWNTSFRTLLCIINVLVTSQRRGTDRGSDKIIESTPTANRTPRIVTPFNSHCAGEQLHPRPTGVRCFFSCQTRKKMLTPTCFSHPRDEGASQALSCPTRGSRARA